MSQLLEVTDAALRKLRAVLPALGPGAPTVRVSARLADTGVPAYDLARADGPAAGDSVITLNGLVVCADPESAMLLAGARIDHLETPAATGFVFRSSDAQLSARVEAALNVIRPRLQVDGGDVELVEVRKARAVLRLLGSCGSCSGCGLEGVTVTRLLEQHLRQAVPELEAVTADTGRSPAVSRFQRPAEQR